ncbi:methionine synthase [Sedimentibacter sp. zth1]|uniref:methionine synthase n=1 Tax=Sedimentibacter sp. zth1 TaxID=2816908 RepID=UPI001A9229F3|nr:methionine synthase [Sedimentibacter sp. zth1]QSX04695.1 methionine synthase [Sedimentibacter sp. zth1]
MNKKVILGASIGNCVHVAGIINFLSIARVQDYETIFLGPATDISYLYQKILEIKPNIIALSYRLTPNNALEILSEIEKFRNNSDLSDIRWCFGGTKPVADVARKFNFFDYISDGFDDIDDCVCFLKGTQKDDNSSNYKNNIVDRINEKYPYPVLRHHFGLPSYEDTLDGIKKIAEAKVLDVISLGPDQNTQQFYFNQENMDRVNDGAGGVPLRNKEDFIKLKEATMHGNFPLIRSYSGTADVFKMADLLIETLDNAWSAIPLCWYNELDGRGNRKVEISIKEAQGLIAYHGKKNITVEINEPHHWSLRDAHDVMSVFMAYVSSYNAKKFGVKNYIAQYMFNTPNTLSFSMDLARVLAMVELVESLKDENFNIFRQVRAGLNYLSPDLDVAKGQLAATTFLSMNIRPHIVHVVGFNEAEHAATPDNIIESCKIVRGVLRNVVNDHLDLTINPEIIERKKQLIEEANYLKEFICNFYKDYDDPLANAFVLSDCIKRGILDAPHIVKNKKIRGILETRVQDGKCVAFSKKLGRNICERERIEELKSNGNLD